MNIKSFRLILFLAVSTFFSSFVNAQNPYNLVGQKHNEYVRYVLNNMATRPAEGTVVSTIQQLLGQVFEGGGVNPIFPIPETNAYNDILSRVRANRSAQVNQKVDQVQAFLATEPTVAQVNSFIAGLESTAASSVPQNEQLPYLCFLATIKYSAQLWLPVSKGGENAFSLFRFTPNNNGAGVQERKGGPAGVIIADGLGVLEGAGASLIESGGASALPGPLGVPWAGWAGLFVGAAHSVKAAF